MIRLTDERRRLIHETPDLRMQFDLASDYHRVLTDPEERDCFLNWLRRNDVLFHTVMNCALKEVDEPHVYEAVAIILMRECRRLLREGEVARRIMLRAEPEPHPESTCDDCGGENVTWSAPNDIWNAIVRPNGEVGDPMLCPSCFMRRARAAGFNPIWRVTNEGGVS